MELNVAEEDVEREMTGNRRFVFVHTSGLIIVNNGLEWLRVWLC